MSDTEDDLYTFTDLLREHAFIYNIKSRVNRLGRSNGFNTIMFQFEYMEKFTNPYPQYTRIEKNLHKWINDFEVRFVKEMHEELEKFMNGTGRIREQNIFTTDATTYKNVKIDGENFYDAVKSIKTFKDFANLQGRWRELVINGWSSTAEERDCVIFPSCFLHDTEPYENIVPIEELKAEEEKLTIIENSLNARIKATRELCSA